MNTTQYLAQVIDELTRSIGFISDEEAEKLVNAILESKKVFVAGAGRSGFMAKSFTMRLMHMGIDAYILGETVTPPFQEEDIIIIGTGSGETKSLVTVAENARKIGGMVAAVTISPQSTIGQLADFTVKLPGSPKDQAKGNYKTIQPMGSLFEQTLLLLFDSIILRIMEKKGLDSSKMYGKHANLE
ncbi:6-phospho-3-hexuloisomerase [Peribacillus sp. SCS-37]|uniref:6-phospho-3-hexuloisomerase n=1 Tax=Paraperibacillus esterisolvens TaxID=3115296 RepID=UPI0039066E68